MGKKSSFRWLSKLFWMNSKTKLLLIFFTAIFFTTILYDRSPGLNLLIAESFIIVILYFTKQYQFKENIQRILVSGFILTSIFTIITHSILSYLVNFLAFALFIGIIIYPEARSIITSARLSIYHAFAAQFIFISELTDSKLVGKTVSRIFYKLKIAAIPIVIIFIFIGMYRLSNHIFNDIIEKIIQFLNDKFYIIFKNIDIPLLITFFFFLFVSNYIFLRSRKENIILRDKNASDIILRRKLNTRRNFKLNSLKVEYKAALFLLIILNLLLLIVNSIDIYWVWFNFEWNGQYLKEFVHAGTYLLLASILISIFIVLHFYRRNINFLTKNNLLKYLSLIWLAQNAILTISVGIRNYHYVEYFALAYKRIAVFIFLGLTLYGLYTVIIKVLKKKSSFYVYRKNAMAVYIALVISSGFNWDSIIAKYNFDHAGKSFLHLNFMARLSFKTLPLQDKSLEELNKIDSVQKAKFPFEKSYISPEFYHERIQLRKAHFKADWEKNDFLSWNLPEYLAYKELFIKE